MIDRNLADRGIAFMNFQQLPTKFFLLRKIYRRIIYHIFTEIIDIFIGFLSDLLSPSIKSARK